MLVKVNLLIKSRYRIMIFLKILLWNAYYDWKNILIMFFFGSSGFVIKVWFILFYFFLSFRPFFIFFRFSLIIFASLHFPLLLFFSLLFSFLFSFHFPSFFFCSLCSLPFFSLLCPYYIFVSYSFFILFIFILFHFRPIQSYWREEQWCLTLREAKLTSQFNDH